jgi:acyl-coenzyme A synthetase/AMP-(fatty) acid ligase
VLAPESAVAKLKDTVQATGAKLLPVEASLFSGALVPDEQAHAEGASAAAATAAGERARSHAAAGFSGGGAAAAGEGALIIYTSGTTGRPKGALHTHG